MTGFHRILADLNDGGVRFVLIGGIAVIRHGFVRATRDVDVLVESSEDNFAAIRSVMAGWAATRPDGSPVVSEEVTPGHSVHLRTRHGYVDFLPERAGLPPFRDLLHRADRRKVDGVDVPIVSLADLVVLKRFAGREQDLFDLRRLEEVHGALPDLP